MRDLIPAGKLLKLRCTSAHPFLCTHVHNWRTVERIFIKYTAVEFHEKMLSHVNFGLNQPTITSSSQ